MLRESSVRLHKGVAVSRGLCSLQNCFYNLQGFFCFLFGTMGPPLAPYGELLGLLGDPWGPPWPPLGAPWVSQGSLEGPRGNFGGLWGILLGGLGLPLGPLGSSLDPFGPPDRSKRQTVGFQKTV